MQFPQQLVTEITAPNTIPFQPGNDVTGIGASIPPELAVAGFTNAIVFYNSKTHGSGWDPTSTLPKVKFAFIAAIGGEIVCGYGYCVNPSVNQTAVIVITENIALASSGSTIETVYTWPLSNGVVGTQLAEDSLVYGSEGSPVLQMHTFAGKLSTELRANSAFSRFNCYDANGTVVKSFLGYFSGPGISQLQLKNFQFQVLDSDTQNQAYVFGFILRDTAWQNPSAFLVNGWAVDAANPAQYRLSSDGTVIWRGRLTKATNPVNGENITNNFDSIYNPGSDAYFLVPPAGSTYNGTQKLEVVGVASGRGTFKIWDPPAAPGDVMMSGVRWPVYYLP